MADAIERPLMTLPTTISNKIPDIDGSNERKVVGIRLFSKAAVVPKSGTSAAQLDVSTYQETLYLYPIERIRHATPK